MRRLLLGFGAIIASLVMVLGFTTGNARADTGYEIFMAENHSKCITSDIHPHNGSLVVVYDCYGNQNQLWHLYYEYTDSQGFPFYRWVFGVPDAGNGNALCLDVPGNTTVDGTLLQLYTCNGTDAQSWSYLRDGLAPNWFDPNVKWLALYGNDLVNNTAFEIWHTTGAYSEICYNVC